MKIAVLIYHDVLPGRLLDRLDIRQRFYTLSLEEFEAHVDYIASAGIDTVNTGTIHRAGESEHHTVYFTFDDGLASAYRCAQILHQKGFTATFFIVTDFVGHDRYLSWEEIRRMAAIGMDIQSHTCSHPIMTELSNNRLIEELSRSKMIIEDQLGDEVTAISIPQGFENDRIIRNAHEQGYRYIFTSRPGLFDPKRAGPISRLSIFNRTSKTNFKRLIHHNRCAILKQQASKELLSVPKKILGNRNYHLVRTKLLKMIRN